jgi:S-adenosylmethionine:tRNA ribosyltransferase-isomerase
VIAVGTTVVRALESAWDGRAVRAASGFTRLFVEPQRGVHTIDGLITGFHDPEATHLAMLHAIDGERRIAEAYDEAVRAGYLWHEFGDSHLILPGESARTAATSSPRSFRRS